MKTTILAFVFLLFGNVFVYSQSVGNEKLSVSVDLGSGSFFGHSNLSSYGVHYRSEYKGGFSGNIKASYLLGKVFQAGVKFNLFSSSEDYNLVKEKRVADDLDLIYIAPQIGYRMMITENWRFDCMIGAGYMHYQSKSLCDDMERKCNKGFFGTNADLSIIRHLFRNLYVGANVSVTGGHTSSLTEEVKGVEKTLELDKWNRIKVFRADLMLSVKVLL